MSVEDLIAARQAQYGEPQAHFQAVAYMWSLVVSEGANPHLITPSQVCTMMALLKIGRNMTGGPSEDTYNDIEGYLHLARMLRGLPF